MTIRVGLVGAGPWARGVHAAGLVASPRTEFAGVWARRTEAAEALRVEHGGRAYESVTTLLADVDAVACAVPPEVQADVATQAAEAGRHLVLDKPLAADLAAAERLADAADAAGVRSAVFFTARYSDHGREFVAAARKRDDWQGAHAVWVSGALLDGPFAASPWRHERGALWDVGPHAVELLDAALGSVIQVRAAARTSGDLVQLLVEHEGGQLSEVTATLRVPIDPSIGTVTLFGDGGALAFSTDKVDAHAAYAVLLEQFADAVEGHGRGPTCDAQRGLAVQRVLQQAEDRLSVSG